MINKISAHQIQNIHDRELNDEQLSHVTGGNGLSSKPEKGYVLEYGTPGHLSRQPKRDYVLEYGTPGHIQ